MGCVDAISKVCNVYNLDMRGRGLCGNPESYSYLFFKQYIFIYFKLSNQLLNTFYFILFF